MLYKLIQINGHAYVQHVQGGCLPATAPEREFWERLQSEIRQKRALLASYEDLQARMMVMEYNFRELLAEKEAGDYPVNWPEIATMIKAVAGWHCEHCGHVDDHATRHTLTVHHLDRDPANCDYTNLVALCQRCHLHIQARYTPGQQLLPGIEVPEWMVKRGLA